MVESNSPKSNRKKIITLMSFMNVSS